jgi:hypothetical protein
VLNFPSVRRVEYVRLEQDLVGAIVQQEAKSARTSTARFANQRASSMSRA